MLDGHPLAECAPEGRGDCRGEGDLRHQQQHAPALRVDALGQPQVDLGLAAPGHAVQHDRVKSAGAGQRREPIEGGRLFVGEHDRRDRHGARARQVERIALDPAARERDEPERGEPRQRVRPNPVAPQLGGVDAVGSAVQQVERGALSLPEAQGRRIVRLRAGDVEPFCRQLDDPCGAIGGGLALERLGERDEAVALERHQRCVDAASGSANRSDADRPAPLELLQHRPAQAALARRLRHPDVGDPRVPFAFDPRARRHRRRHRLADAAGIVVGDPGGQRHHLRRQERLVVQHVEELLDLVEGGGVRGGGVSRAEHAAGQDAGAERHEHAGADGGHRRRAGQRVGERTEQGNGNGDRDEAHLPLYSLPATGSCSSARTFFMSSQTSRLRSGLRSRNAGWNVGTSLAPR